MSYIPKAYQSSPKFRSSKRFYRKHGNVIYNNKSPSKVQDLLSSALSSVGIKKQVARYDFVLHWDHIVGEEIAKRTKPAYIKGDTLVCTVSSSSWAQELSFQKDFILHQLRPHLAKNQQLSNILFVVGSV